MSNTTSAERVEGIRRLAHELLDRTILNTARSRSRCKELAREIIDLLEAEDAEEEAPAASTTPALEEARLAVEQLSSAIRASIDAREQAALTRLYTMSERVLRQRQSGQE